MLLKSSVFSFDVLCIVTFNVYVLHLMLLKVYYLRYDHHQWVLVLLSGGFYYYALLLLQSASVQFSCFLIRTKDRTYAKVCCAIHYLSSNKLSLSYYIFRVFLVEM